MYAFPCKALKPFSSFICFIKNNLQHPVFEGPIIQIMSIYLHNTPSCKWTHLIQLYLEANAIKRMMWKVHMAAESLSCNEAVIWRWVGLTRMVTCYPTLQGSSVHRRFRMWHKNMFWLVHISYIYFPTSFWVWTAIWWISFVWRRRALQQRSSFSFDEIRHPEKFIYRLKWERSVGASELLAEWDSRCFDWRPLWRVA